MLTVNLLGPPEALLDGEPIRVDTNKAIALLAYLVVERAARRDTLAGLLWGDSTQERARATLRRTLSALRSAAGGDLVQSDRNSVTLAGEVVSDYGQLLAELDNTTSHGHQTGDVCPRCVPHLERASSLYRGDFLQGFGVRSAPEFENWSRSVAQSLRIRMGSAFERLASAHAAAGDYAGATAAVARWIDLDPLHEPAHRLLMLLRAWAGDRPGSIDAYRACVAVLDQELAVPPLEETTELYEAILDEDLPPPPGVRRRIGSRQASAKAPTDLIDRAAEMRALRGALDAARAGGLIVSLTGAPWMGKTRLTDELVREAPDWLVLQARGFRMERDLPYGVMAQMLTQAVGRLGEIELPPWVLGEISRLVPGRGSAASPDPLGERRLLEALQIAVTALASHQPLLMIIDDVHWADAPSAAVVAYMARRWEGTSALLLLVAREGEGLPSDLAEVMAGSDLRLFLQPLSLEQLLPLTRHDEAAARLLEARTGGVPLLAAEAVASHDGSSTPGMTRYLETRWGELADLERQLLTAAAVLGGTCDPELLRATSGRGEEEVVEGVERLQKLGLLEETTEGVSFTLDAMERLAYESVSLVRRRLLHGRAAEALSEQPGGQREARSAAAIAAHYQAAGRPEAAHWHMVAGDLSRSVYANDSARQFYESALALGTDRVAEARLAIAELEMASGRYEESRRQLTLAENFGGDCAAVIQHRLGDVERLSGRFDTAEAHYRLALEMGAPPVEVLSTWSLLAMRTGRPGYAAQLAEQARIAAEAGGRRAEHSRVRSILAAVTTDSDEALGHAEEAARLAGDDELLLMAALNSQALVLADREEFDRAAGALERAITIAARTGHRHREAALWSHLADIRHRAGREQDARELQTRAVSIFADIDAGGFQPELWLLIRW